MASKYVVMASSFTGEAFESIVVDVSDSESDSGSWQVIDPSDSDDENFSYGDVTTTEEEEDVADAADVDDLLQHPYGSPSSDISMQSLADQITHHYQELKDAYEINHHREIIRGDEDVADVDKIFHHCQEFKHANKTDHRRDTTGDATAVKDGGSIGDGDDLFDEDDNDDSELDDELVPKWLNHKFERQRIRKLGKKGKKSKRMAYQYNRPGCVHGKHGLGLKHNLIW